MKDKFDSKNLSKYLKNFTTIKGHNHDKEDSLYLINFTPNDKLYLSFCGYDNKQNIPYNKNKYFIINKLYYH